MRRRRAFDIVDRDAVMIMAMVAWTAHGGSPSLSAAALTTSGLRLTLAALAARRCSALRAAAA